MDHLLNERKLVTSFASENKSVTQLGFINKDPNGVKIESLRGGLVNYCFRVSSQDGKYSVILKQAKDTAKGFEVDNLNSKRQTLEYDCLEFLHSLIPGNVPEPYCLDTTHNIIAMQDLGDWDILGDYLQNQDPDLTVASELGRVLVKMHQATSKVNVDPEQWKQLGRFRQVEVADMGYHFCCKKYHENPENRGHIPKELEEVYQECCKGFDLTDFQEKLRRVFYKERCLVQLDSHWRSVFVKDGHIAMFDFEFAFLGHPGISLGYYIVSFFGCYLVYVDKHKQISDTLSTSDEQNTLKQKFHQATIIMLSRYMEDVRDLAEEDFGDFMSESALFSGAEMILLSLFENITGFDAGVTTEIRVHFLQCGFMLIKSHDKIRTIKQLTDAVFKD